MNKSTTLQTFLTSRHTIGGQAGSRFSSNVFSFLFTVFLFTFFVLRTTSLVNAQESKVDKTDLNISSNIKIPNAPQAPPDTVSIKNSSGDVLMTVTDEGTGGGSIKLNDIGALSPAVNKLYNNGGSLYWNGSALGSGSGATALDNLTDAQYDGASVYVGNGAGGTRDNGSNHNAAIGKDALNSNTSGIMNVANGSASLRNNQTGNANTAVGHLSASTSSTADSNTAIGWQALRFNSTGISNTATGTAALWKNTIGNYNTATGQNALYSNQTGNNNTAVGYNSLLKNTVSANTAVGNEALNANTIGANNAALGDNALKNNVDGSGNVGLGKSALFTNNSGGGNVGIGINSLYRNTSGSSNIALGQGTQYYNTTGSNNIGIGYRANLNNAVGTNNTIIGHEAGGGGGTHDKSGSVFLGFNAGFSEITSNKLYIENSNSTTPLIWGDFTNDSVKINGHFEVNNKIKTPSLQITTGAQNGYVLKSDANGNASWQFNSGGGGTDSDWNINGNNLYSIPSGNAGIGTTTPNSKLSVNGSGLSHASIYGENPDTNGIGVYGYATEELASGGQPGSQAHNFGGYFVANGMHGKGVYASAPSSMYGRNFGGYFVANGVYGTGVYGEATSAGGTETDYRYGGYFKSSSVWGKAVYGFIDGSGVGIHGESNGSGKGILGESVSGIGVKGHSVSSFAGQFISDQSTALDCQTAGNSRYAVQATTTGANAFTVRANSSGADGIGVQAEADGTNGIAFRAFVNGAGGSAAWLGGDVTVTGTLSKGGGSFKIDHPLDPENKYLYHSFVESPDMMNIYNGNIITNSSGDATIEMPDWFNALNRDFRYQLTVIGQFSQAIVSEKINNNRFSIKTDKPNVEVSWQVTGIRQDNFANENRIPVEEVKEDKEKGKYLYPAAYNMPKSAGVGYDARFVK